MSRRAALAAALVLTPCATFAQVDGLFDDMASKELYEALRESSPLAANLDAAFFFKNNEYFSPHAEGYTLIGYQLRPTLTYSPLEQLHLTGGLQALVYGGLEKAHYVRPHFAALWQATDWLGIQMGSLPGAASHPTHEAVQDPETQLTDDPELGLQIWLRRPRLNGSAWLNWRQFIFLGDTIPERFTAGFSMSFTPSPGKIGASFKMPFALIFNHIGGQISNYPQKMQSIANVAISPTLALRTEAFVQEIDFSLHVLAFHAMAGSEVRPFADGMALCPEVSLTAKYLRANVEWYHAQNFYAPQGNPLLSSLSNYDETYYDKKRNLLILGASFVKGIGTIGRFAVDAKGYLDTDASRFDYSYGITMVLTPGIHSHVGVIWQCLPLLLTSNRGSARDNQ